MARFVSGDVVVVPFPFTDLSATKVRPAIVLAAFTLGRRPASVLPDAEDAWLAMIADDLRECFADLAQVQERMRRTREQMIGLIDTLRQKGRDPPAGASRLDQPVHARAHPRRDRPAARLQLH